MRAFNQLDADRDGALTEDELGLDAAPPREEMLTVALKSGRERGLSDGRQAGREDSAADPALLPEALECCEAPCRRPGSQTQARAPRHRATR